MLVELGLVEQRYKAVLEVLNDGASVTDVARRYGVGRQAVHTWLRRYGDGGLGPWLIGVPGPTPAHTKCHRWSRPRSSRCDASILPGVLAPS